MRLLLVSFLVVFSAAAADCDRGCLEGFVTRYLDAMVAHNPGALALSGRDRFTENSEEMRLGEGLWKDASRITPYRVDILDVRQGVAASLVVVDEGSSPVLLALRLKIAGNQISEVETLVTRTQKEGALFNIANLQTPRKDFTFAPDRSQLVSREEAIRIAEYYPAGLKVGSFVSVDAPFASDAYRLENGGIMAGPGCARAGCENIKTQNIIKHPAITHSVAAVDEELGIVLLRMNFGDTGSYGPGNSLHVFEAFKVYGGQIHAVEAFMRVMPANVGSG
jgi:hypothetical protein